MKELVEVIVKAADNFISEREKSNESKKVFMYASMHGSGFFAGSGSGGSDGGCPNRSAGKIILDFDTLVYSSVDYENGQEAKLDDSGFEKVSVPHANTILDTHKGNQFPNEIASYRFVSWYRRHF